MRNRSFGSSSTIMMVAWYVFITDGAKYNSVVQRYNGVPGARRAPALAEEDQVSQISPSQIEQHELVSRALSELYTILRRRRGQVRAISSDNRHRGIRSREAIRV